MDFHENTFPIKEELAFRRNLWKNLLDTGGPRGIAPSVLRDLRIYGGAQGIWVDKARTSGLTEDDEGVTVSLLHTGTAYADDLADDGILYHYPSTNRPSARDLSEINATKAAGRLGIPVFVITYPSPSLSRRDVRLGWVGDWDDESKLFLVTFGDERPSLPGGKPIDSEPFKLVRKAKSVKKQVEARPGQQRFKFRVFQRYGPKCAVCDMNIVEVLDAAHIRPKKQNGSDDPRNGLVLCALHHRALDSRLFAIDPGTLKIHYKKSGPDAAALYIEYHSLEHLPKKPHKEALEWLWKRWETMH